MKRIEIEDDVKALLDRAVTAEEVYVKLYNRVDEGSLELPTASSVLRSALRASVDSSYDCVAALAQLEEGGS